ncbi:DUF4350 domain-containing protein [Egicoccus sp. AB-alg6-2]|uniref:DUF4350 domain-containing protein n=1 Tax=Egicoccus sp. AB-alg6-2 TaxID=3242692 RepID=UPI00359D0629
MSAAAQQQQSSRGQVLRGRLGVAAAVVALVVAALLTGTTTTDEPLDPRSAGPDGLRGLVDVLTAVDVEVEVALEPPADRSTTAFVPIDRLSPQRRDDWSAWVRDGGRLVVADPVSPLHELVAVGSGVVDVIGPTTRTAGCAPLRDVRLTHADWVGFEVPEGAGEACFVLDGTDRSRAWLVAQRQGGGTVVALGSATPFTNRLLDDEDHAVLAAALLAPSPGSAVQIVPRGPVGEGERSLLDLVADNVWHGLAVLLAAVVVAASARGRRLGRPVPEPLPPVLPSDELTTSLAHLLQSSGRRDAAARRLREDARQAVARAVGVPPHGPPGRLLELAIHRLGLDPRTATDALGDGAVSDDRQLLAVHEAVRRTRARARADVSSDRPDDPST